MAVQVTELVDGIFFACSMNHCLPEVKSFWNLLNIWAQITRNGSNHIASDSKLASFERWFPHNNIERPIRIPFRKIMENYRRESINSLQPPPFPRRIFHFEAEKIAELKAKVNSEEEDGVISNKISSLQAILAQVWRSVIKNQNLDPEEEVTYRFLVAARSRISHPPIPDNYFGITVRFATVTMKVRDLVGDGGRGRFALEMNNMVTSYTEERIKRDFEAGVQIPTMRSLRSRIGKIMGTSSSPRVNFYAIDFGWGRPVAVRGGPANAKSWKLMVDAGIEEGSLGIELSASCELLEALGKEPEFKHAVAPPSLRWLPAELSNKVARTRL
ncbi:uncharacterized acetyltransferase At3g50280-like [Prosopis cineraria]|uniref:uncharacterized acetyltransferase At3g50280-like n=1 Tax=Prosopis cineraria TaxID=364024 RepID=UPI00241085A6|nr:uncharacterized acetyltransferase At3g50280-like [Prosopis cineraria]